MLGQRSRVSGSDGYTPASRSSPETGCSATSPGSAVGLASCGSPSPSTDLRNESGTWMSSRYGWGLSLRFCSRPNTASRTSCWCPLYIPLHDPGQAISGSPTRLQKEDAEVIIDALQRAKQTPVLRPFDKKMAERVPVANKGAAIAREEEVSPGQPSLCAWLPTFSQLRG